MEQESTGQDELTPDVIDRIRRIGEMHREIDDAAQQNDAPIVSRVLLVWQEVAEQSARNAE